MAQNCELEEVLESKSSTPSIHLRRGIGELVAETPSSSRMSVSTPSWMFEQKQKRPNRKGYGRKFSMEVRSNATVNRLKDADALLDRFSDVSPIDIKREIEEEDIDETIYNSPVYSSTVYLDEDVSFQSQSSAHEVKNEEFQTSKCGKTTKMHSKNSDSSGCNDTGYTGSRRLRSLRSTHDVNELIPEELNARAVVNRIKKKRPNLPRPPQNKKPPLHSATSKSSTLPEVSATVHSSQTYSYNRSHSTSDLNEASACSFVEHSLNADLNFSELESKPRDNHKEEEKLFFKKQHQSTGPSSVLEREEVAKRSKVMIRRSQSVVVSSSFSSELSAIKSLEENVHPNDITSRRSASTYKKTSSLSSTASSTHIYLSKDGNTNCIEYDKTTVSGLKKKRSSKKRTASTRGFDRNADLDFQSDLEPSPPKIQARSQSMGSFSSNSFSSSADGLPINGIGVDSVIGKESFSSLAKKSNTPSWGSLIQQKALSPTNSLRNKDHAVVLTTPLVNSVKTDQEEIPFTGELFDSKSVEYSFGSFLSPEVGEAFSTPSVLSSTSSRKRGMIQTLSPFEMTSSTDRIDDIMSFGESLDIEMNTGGDTIAVRNRIDSDDESSTSDDDSIDSSAISDEILEAGENSKVLTDAEIFDTMSSYDDLKFLTKSLLKWSKTTILKGASMGLSNGCLIAVPSTWTLDHRAKFVKWAVLAFRFRVGSVGGTGGSFLKCNEIEGNETLIKLRKILNEYKAGRLVLSNGQNKLSEASNTGNESSVLFSPWKNRVKLVMKPSSTLRSLNLSPTEPIIPSTFPMHNDAEDLASVFAKRVSIEKKKDKYETKKIPNFMKTISLQPLADKLKKSPLPCFRPSPTTDPNRRGSRLARHSSECAMNGTEILNQIYGSSPRRNVFPKNLRERANRVLHPRRPSNEKPRLIFDGCSHGTIRFDSPHPRSTHQVSSAQLEFGLETPMPKMSENWGSRPLSGKDWGESVSCDSITIDSFRQIFAHSWSTSDFCNNKDLCAVYQICLSEEKQSFLHNFFDRDANADRSDDFDTVSIKAEPFSREYAKSGEIGLQRNDSVGCTDLALLQLDDEIIDFHQSINHNKKIQSKIRKYARMTLCAAATDFLPPQRYLRLSHSPSKIKEKSPSSASPFKIIDGLILSSILSFFNQYELLSISLVCTSWADAALETLSTLLVDSVGYNPSFRSQSIDDSSSEIDYLDTLNEENHDSFRSYSIARSVEKDWSLLLTSYPKGKFLSDGAFKKVYKVWNERCGAFEALSVMDIDMITSTGNSHTISAELAISLLLSSVARRNICPNFVITRGVFTCQYDIPVSEWGGSCNVDDTSLPSSNIKKLSRNHQKLQRGEFGNFQYIRMELCKHNDMEDFIRKMPGKMFAPRDCRNLLFQMAFALHVATDKFGLKHYDVKLLNFLLQSATDSSIPLASHPHVVLRYGIGSLVFRLRMHPSTALIAKLSDYGTAVMRTDTDGHPISLGQFTTFENTPPDYLILGNDAEQGHGHDCFGLGLCMFHLFTGHEPYEVILKDVLCPKNFQSQLQNIWKGKKYDVIFSAMMYDGEEESDAKDETLQHTLYRFLVLFGVPKHKFRYRENRKVWQAISATLLKNGPDAHVFEADRKRFSLMEGNEERIANARRRLEESDGAMELLQSLVCFDPKKRATPLNVIHSRFMSSLLECKDSTYDDNDIIRSYMSYATK